MDVSRMPKEGDRFGNWVIERTLDKGGMGMVYLAYNPDLGKSEKVALKVLDPAVAERDADFVKRFYQEASIVFKTHCPNLVSIHDAGRDASSDFYYIVMEYLGGGTLRDRMRSRGRIPWQEALSIVRPVALALAAVSKRNSVHRDIKPENIMFTADGVVKLADFGIAKATQDDVPDNADPLKTRALQIFGTPAYMSPEQMSDASAVDARADIWSLGVVLFEMLAGVRPYPAQDLIQAGAFLLSPQPFPDIRTFQIPSETRLQHSTEATMKTQPTMATQATCAETMTFGQAGMTVAPGSGATVDVPDGVADLLFRMCSKDLDKRIATSEDVVAIIDGLLSESDQTSNATLAAARSASEARPVPPKRKPSAPEKPDRKRIFLRICCAVLFVFLIVLGILVFQKSRKAVKPTPRQATNIIPPSAERGLPAGQPSVNDGVLSTNVKPIVVKKDVEKVVLPPSHTNSVVIVTNASPVSPATPPSTPAKHLQRMSQISVFQPQRGTISFILSQLDAEIGKRPTHLKVSLSAYAQQKELSVERYEQQLLIPAIERLRTSGVSYSLVPGPGRYGSTVQDVARRFGCDIEYP